MAKRNGSDVLLLCDTAGDGSNYVVVGGQRGVVWTGTAAAIDTSDKSSRHFTGLAGRTEDEIKLDGVTVLGDAGAAALDSARTNGTLIKIKKQEAGEVTQQCDAIVTSLELNDPDQAESTYSVALTLSGDWADV